MQLSTPCLGGIADKLQSDEGEPADPALPADPPVPTAPPAPLEPPAPELHGNGHEDIIRQLPRFWASVTEGLEMPPSASIRLWQVLGV
jgi:hypothetical protein